MAMLAAHRSCRSSICGSCAFKVNGRNVLFQQTADLAEKLLDKGVTVEVLALPDEVSGFLRYASRIRIFEPDPFAP